MREPERELVPACIALGANLGDARLTVLQAIQDIDCLPGCLVKAVSRLYRTAPHEAQGPDFVNAVVRIDTRLTAPSLLQALQVLEQAAGRERPYLNAPRTLDLDVLLYGQGQIQSPLLTVPHPRMMDRAFVLRPLADVLPDFVQPQDLQRVQGQSIDTLV
jgi:2-amino-4-hydroxy-6-hydroxymethyldihydropteridine diphosphokinase